MSPFSQIILSSAGASASAPSGPKRVPEKLSDVNLIGLWKTSSVSAAQMVHSKT